MKKKTFICIVFLLLVGGCHTLQGNPRAELKVAEEAYVAIVETLTDMNNAGYIAEDEQILITELVHSGRDLLKDWHEKIVTTGKRPAVADQALYIIRRLAEWQLIKEKEKGGL